MKIFFVAVIVLAVTFVSFAETTANYNSGNGTIVFEEVSSDRIVTIRKCEIEVIIGDLAGEKERVIYNDYVKGSVIGQLEDNDAISLLQVCRIDYPNKPSNRWGSPSGEIWYRIERNATLGWICVSSEFVSEYADPYFENRWQIIDTIESNGKEWTVRTMDQMLAVWEHVNVCDTPGVSGNAVIYTIRPGNTDPHQSNVTIVAMTEQVETIDGRTDHWLKVEYKGFTGWIFGGYATAERGGPKYYIPEENISFGLGWY